MYAKICIPATAKLYITPVAQGYIWHNYSHNIYFLAMNVLGKRGKDREKVHMPIVYPSPPRLVTIRYSAQLLETNTCFTGAINNKIKILCQY
jgi:hypothetical protein